MDGSQPAPRTVHTTCAYCGVGCGVLATPQADGRVHIAGDPAHGANLGRLCVKGAALGETLGLEGRLLYPQQRATAGAAAERVTWGAALDHVAQGFARTIAEHGPDAVAFYVSGQLLTEDYYVANKLMKGYLGSANIDTNSRLCMSSAVAGHKRAFGEDLVTGCYEDFELADLVVLVGSNTAWCHPVLFQRLVAAKKARPALKVVVIDPRHTATCELADLHLPLAPGSDVALFNGLLAYLHQHGVVDTAYLAAHAGGAEQAVAVAAHTSGSLAHVARACQLSEEKLRQFYALWARTEQVVTAFSQGVNQSSSGTDKVSAILNCHLYTGRIGKPGATPFSITGQPNAMGGREVGGLANMLAAHLELGVPEHRALVQSYWNSPVIAERQGLKAVELFEAIHAGRVKAVWIMATNPVVSMPDANRVREALQRCPLVVVSEVMARGDTADLAHVLLPALAWGEKDGTVTNSDRRISRQRAFLPQPGEAQPDWWALAQVGQRLGHAQAFAYADAAAIFNEHVGLTAWRNTAEPVMSPQRNGFAAASATPSTIPRVLNLRGLAGLTAAQYDALAPVQWPVLHAPDGIPRGPLRLTPSPVRLVPVLPRAPAHAVDDDYPLVLNTGRVRDHWHTMTRTGKAPTLAEHTAEPFVELHPQDAMRWGVQEGRLARVVTRWGAAVLRVRCSPGMVRRQLFAPIHWNSRTASDARIGALVNPAVCPASGEPEFKHTPARIEPFFVHWHGFVLSRVPLPEAVLQAQPHLAWWAAVQGTEFVRIEMAGRGSPADFTAWAQRLLSATGPDCDWLEAADTSEGLYRGALLQHDALAACVFLSPRAEDLPTRHWLSSLFARPALAEAERVALLAGSPATAVADAGKTVCACFGVGQNTIDTAIRAGCRTLDALGAQLRCGTNCGSCVPELRQRIEHVLSQQH